MEFIQMQLLSSDLNRNNFSCLSCCVHPCIQIYINIDMLFGFKTIPGKHKSPRFGAVTVVSLYLSVFLWTVYFLLCSPFCILSSYCLSSDLLLPITHFVSSNFFMLKYERYSKLLTTHIIYYHGLNISEHFLTHSK